MNTTVLPVAKAGHKVNAPIPFTGTIMSVSRVVIKGANQQPQTLFSFDISGLPVLTNTNDEGVTKKASVLRTVKQIIADMDGFVEEGSTPDEIYNACKIFAEKRPVTLEVSAHEKGALTVVTENSEYAKAQGKVVGEEVEANSAGFYVDNFLDIDFHRDDRLTLLNSLKLARQASQANAASRAL